jgi:hypothetical protein
MKKKGKIKQQILFEEKTKPFLNDYSVQVQDKIVRKKIKEAIRKIADAAEQRIKKLNAELNFVQEQLKEEIEKREHAVEILRQQEPLLSERVKEISCLYSVISLLGNKKWFFSKLVDESLKDFKRKVAEITKSICFSFDDFDLVIDSF